MILSLIGLAAGLPIGWFACKHYFMVVKTNRLLEIMTSLMHQEITAEEAMDQMKELDKL